MEARHPAHSLSLSTTPMDELGNMPQRRGPMRKRPRRVEEAFNEISLEERPATPPPSPNRRIRPRTMPHPDGLSCLPTPNQWKIGTVEPPSHIYPAEDDCTPYRLAGVRPIRRGARVRGTVCPVDARIEAIIREGRTRVLTVEEAGLKGGTSDTVLMETEEEPLSWPRMAAAGGDGRDGAVKAGGVGDGGRPARNARYIA
mmetsp:Transcript_27092/g.54158  ORF Transcript_27092/g.54158 Transcript_27092/m.54158 type:complete len:200 (-) Transcript_27092:2254-2853(-)